MIQSANGGGAAGVVIYNTLDFVRIVIFPHAAGGWLVPLPLWSVRA